MAVDPVDLLARYSGTTVNNLNKVLNMNKESDPEDGISTFSLTRFIDINELESYLEDHKHEFTVLSLIVQSIRAKFDQLSIVLCTHYNEGMSFSIIGFHDTWLAKHGDVISFFYLVTV